MTSGKSALDTEWRQFQKKEQRFLANRAEKKDTVLNKKLEEKVPEKLQGTLDAAFAKAFGMIFEKGTGAIAVSPSHNLPIFSGSASKSFFQYFHSIISLE